MLGLGIVRAPLEFAGPYLEAGQLVEVLRDWKEPDLDIHALFPAGGTLVPKTRAFLDLLLEWYAA